MANNPEMTLIKGGYLVTMDPQLGSFIGDVLVEGSEIVDVGANLRRQTHDGANVIDARNRLVVPGFIDNHNHMWQGVMPNVSCNHTFGEYFQHTLDGINPQLTPEDAKLGATWSALGAINAGTTTVLHWDHGGSRTPEFAHAGIDGLKDTRIRAVYAYGPPAHSQGWFDSEGAPEPDEVRAVLESLEPNGLTRGGLAIRGPEFSTMDRVRADMELARELGVIVTMHAGIPGPDFFARHNSPRLMEEAGLLGPDVTFVHCNAMDVPDFERIRKHGAHVSLSPVVDMQMGLGQSPLGKIREAGLSPTVSTDVPSAVGASLPLQAYMLLQGYRDRAQAEALAAGGPPLEELPINLDEALPYFTRNAAESLKMADTIGSLTVGRQADIVLIDTENPDMFLRPTADAPAAVVQGAHPGVVTDVSVAGRWVKRNGELTVMSKPEMVDLRRRAKAANARLLGR